MGKYGIAKRGYGKALRQNFGLGGMVIKKISKEAAREKGAKKISDIVSKKRKEYIESKKELDLKKLKTLPPKKAEEVKKLDKESKELYKIPYKDTTRAQREKMAESSEVVAEELNAIKSQKKILEAKDVKEFGDTRPESFKTYKGKKLEGKTWEDRAKQRQKLIEMED
jgi:hypothetical protein